MACAFTRERTLHVARRPPNCPQFAFPSLYYVECAADLLGRPRLLLKIDIHKHVALFSGFSPVLICTVRG